MARVTAGTTDGIESTLHPSVEKYDVEKANDPKDPDGAGAPELAEVKELRYALRHRDPARRYR